MDFVADLDAPLLQLSAQDRFTLRDACQGVHVFGGIGSGKTSGSGKALAAAYLRAGMGGLVLCAKPEEVEQWCRYAAENNRVESTMLFGERGGHGFNFIDYELARQGASGIGSVVECLMRILEAARLAHPNAGQGQQFWDDAMRQLLRNTIPALYAATGTVRMSDITRFISSAPMSLDQAHSTAWQGSSFMFSTMMAAEKNPVVRLDAQDLAKIGSYWHDEFAQLDPKTRSNIAISVSTALDRFNRGRLHTAFCTDTTFVPEMTFHGAVVILDMSALTWNEDGIIGQQLVKYMWQRAVLSRNALAPQHRERPVFLWADESQYFVNSYDTDFQSTCRGSRACTVYLTQSLPTYYAKIGGEQAKHKADMLLANFVTKVFHNNADPETNRWAADTIGRVLQQRANYSEGTSNSRSRSMSEGESSNWGANASVSVSRDAHGNYSTSSSSGTNWGGGENLSRNRGATRGDSTSSGYSETMDYEIEPGAFSRILKTGGPANGNNVTAVWFQAGKVFRDSHRNYLLTRFVQ
ncbi:MAG: TraM recognition domain-containing protein [Proteobacteria bacterium]|nr:TraM recognition domain-containing protein [Pseudomonadota bacterium]